MIVSLVDGSLFLTFYGAGPGSGRLREQTDAIQLKMNVEKKENIFHGKDSLK